MNTAIQRTSANRTAVNRTAVHGGPYGVVLLCVLVALSGCRSTRVVGGPEPEPDPVAPTPVRDAAPRIDVGGGVIPPAEICHPVESRSCVPGAIETIDSEPGREIKPISVARSGSRVAIVYSRVYVDQNPAFLTNDDCDTDVDCRNSARPNALCETGAGKCVQMPTMTKNIFMQIVDGTAAARRVQLTANLSIESSPAIVAAGNRFVVAWRSNRDDNYEIYAQAFDNNGQAMSAAQRITRDSGTEPHADGEPSLAYNGTNVLLSWIQSDPTASAVRRGFAISLTPDGAAMGTAVPLTLPAGMVITNPKFVATGSGYAMFWPNEYAMPSRAFRAVFNGTTVSDVTAISAAGSIAELTANVAGPSTLAIDAAEGIFVYGVRNGSRTEVRGRRLTPAAALNMERPDEGRVTPDGDRSWDPGAARHSGGYVIAQRYVGQANPTPYARVSIAQSNFNVVRNIDLGAVATDGSPMHASAADGNIVIAWADATPEATTIRIARIACQLQ